MRYFNKQVITSLVLLGSLVIGSGLYYFSLVSSDRLIMDRNSIEYLVLVPDILKEIPLEQADQFMGYYFTTATDASPAMVSLKYVTQNFAGTALEKLVHYFDDAGFENINDIYTKDATEITITFTTSELGAVLFNISFTEY